MIERRPKYIYLPKSIHITDAERLIIYFLLKCSFETVPVINNGKLKAIKQVYGIHFTQPIFRDLIAAEDIYRALNLSK